MRITKIIVQASFYYVILRFIIWLLQLSDRSLADIISYHHSSSLYWYTINFYLPILVSILIAFKLRVKFLHKVGIILLPLLILGTLIGGIKNKDYWGYYFKRPAIFKEVKRASEIISISPISKMSEDSIFQMHVVDTSFSLQLYGREDPYYGSMDRAFMTLQDNASHENRKNLFRWNQILRDSTKKILEGNLIELSNLIIKKGSIIRARKGYAKEGNSLAGFAIDFRTIDQSRYVYVCLKSGQLENDHYGLYEFLISDDNFKKIYASQKYFTDFAGIEGFEYCNVAGIVEFILLLGSCILVSVFEILKYLIKKKTG